MKKFVKIVGILLSVSILVNLCLGVSFELTASADAKIDLSLGSNSPILPAGMKVKVSAEVSEALTASQLQFYEMGRLVHTVTDLGGDLSYKTTVRNGTHTVYARLVDKDGNTLSVSDKIVITGSRETTTDTMWDIDFEDEYFHYEPTAPEWRYVYGADDALLSQTRGGAVSSLRAHTGDTSNDMTIEASSDASHGNAIKMTTVTSAQNQFNEFRARNAGGVMVAEWDWKLEKIPQKQSGLTVKIMEPNLAKNGAGNGVAATPYIALMYSGNEAYLGWTNGTDNIYWNKAEAGVWYNIKTYTDFENGIITYCINDECIATHTFDESVYIWTEKYRTSFYNSKGAVAWVDNFKVYKAEYSPFVGIGGVEYSINNEATDTITDGNLAITSYLSNDGIACDCIYYAAVYSDSKTLARVYRIPVSFKTDETLKTLTTDVGEVTSDMTVKTFLWLLGSMIPYSGSASFSQYIPENPPETYWKVDFENGSRLSAVYGSKGNVIQTVTEPNGNHCIAFERSTASDFHLDMYAEAYPSDNVVYQYDIKLAKKDVSFTSYLISSTSNALQYSVESGMLKAGEREASLSIGNWHTVSAVYRVSGGVFDIYLDYKLLCESIPVSADFYHPDVEKWRLHAYRTSGDDNFYIDNVAVYNSAVPCRLGRGFVISDTASVCESDKAQADFLADKVSYHTRSGVICSGEGKDAVTPIEYDGVTYVPLSFFEKAFGLSTSCDNSGSIAKIDSFTLEADSAVCKLSNGEIALDYPTRIINGEFAVPLISFAEKCLGKYVEYDNSTVSGGFVVISDYETALPEAEALQKLNDYMLYLRPSKDEIFEDFKKSGKAGNHPRVLADADDFEKIRSLVKTDSTMKWWADKIIAEADKLCEDNTPLVYELRDGVRLLYVSYDMIDHMFSLGMAYQLSGNKKYAERAWIDLESVAGFADWHPQHALDVGAMACGYAVGYDWMYDAFTSSQLAYIEKGALRCGFSVYEDGYQNHNSYMANGITMENNWSMVMNGGATMLGAAFYDVYPEYSSYLISSAIRCIEFAIYKYAPEGSWKEGMGYAGMALEYLTYQLATLKDIFGTVYTLDATDGLDKIPEFYLYMQTPMGCFGYGDGASQNVHFDAGMLWIGSHFGDYSTLMTYNNLFGFGIDVRNLLWYEPEKISGNTELSLDKLYDSLSVLTMRDTWDKNEHKAFAGIKGFEVDVGHGHLDHGSFMFYSGGTRWTHDFSNENYNLPGYWQGATHKDPRWQYYRVRGEGHNTLIINPDEYGEFDPSKRARFIRYESKPNGVIGVIDTTEANMGKAKKVQRGVYFADNRRSLVVRDEIQTNGECTMYWFLHTQQNAKLTHDGKGVIMTDKTD
ncbi:MAG: heparinase II/III family protein, partial [Clostridia bacterium]|nr:heparinase II/III family protein [Clostridia bacterium]